MDKVIRGILNDGKIRIFLADVSLTAIEICRRHNLPANGCDALARLISVGAIMGAMQKSGNLTLKIDADGPLKTLMVTADSKGNVRGFVANSAIDPSLRSVPDLIGHNGILTVIKSLGLKQDFSSQVHLQTSEIGTDFSYYFKESEQTDSVVVVGNKIGPDIFKAGALIIQIMPGADDIDYLYVDNFSKQCPPMSEILALEDLTTALKALFPEVEILGEQEIRFKCNCSKGRFIAGIASLPTSEIESMIKEDHSFPVFCNFCNQEYEITKEDLEFALKMKGERFN